MPRSILLAAALAAHAQPGVFDSQQLIKYTPEWKGERFPDGRPKVPDCILKRMANVTLEEAWAVLRNAGFNYQYEDGWLSIHPARCSSAARSPRSGSPAGPTSTR